MKVPILILAVITLTFGACATGNQAQGLGGGSVQVNQFAADVFVVDFFSDGHSSPEQARDLTMLRAADLLLSKGFAYFAITSQSGYVGFSSYVIPTEPLTDGKIIYYGNSAKPEGQPIFVGTPKIELGIKSFKDKPEGSEATLFDADFVSKSIRQKYGMTSRQG